MATEANGREMTSAPCDGDELEIATSDAVARMCTHVARLTLDAELTRNDDSLDPTSGIRKIVSDCRLPETKQAAASEEPCRARSAGVLHALMQFEAEYRRDLSQEDSPDLPESSSTPVCVAVGKRVVDMDFASSWQLLSDGATELAERGHKSPYMEGVISALRSLVRSVEIQLEQVVLRQVERARIGEATRNPSDAGTMNAAGGLKTNTVRMSDGRDGSESSGSSATPDDKGILLSLLFVALTSATRPRLRRALGFDYNEELVDNLVAQGHLQYLSLDSSAMSISPAGASQARSILATVA